MGIGLQSTGEAAADALGLNPGDVLPGVNGVNSVDKGVEVGLEDRVQMNFK